MIPMLLRPVTHGIEAEYKCVASGAFIEVLHMHYLEARLIHLMVRIEVRIYRQLRIGDHFHNRRMGELSPLGIVEDINLDLANATSQLIPERSMTIIESAQRLRMIHLQILALARSETGVIAFVGTNHLDLIDMHYLVLHRLGP